VCIIAVPLYIIWLGFIMEKALHILIKEKMAEAELWHYSREVKKRLKALLKALTFFTVVSLVYTLKATVHSSSAHIQRSLMKACYMPVDCESNIDHLSFRKCTRPSAHFQLIGLNRSFFYYY